jgi:hypothetical protein
VAGRMRAGGGSAAEVRRSSMNGVPTTA